MGTREAQEKRHALINGFPSELAGSVVGVLFANTHLTQRQFDAALKYRRNWCMALGKPEVNYEPLARFLPWQGVEVGEDSVENATRRLRKHNEALSEEQYNAVVDTTLFEYLPGWFACSKQHRAPPASEVARRDALLSGLTLLADLMGLAKDG